VASALHADVAGHREILVLVSAAGLSYEEAAEICGCAVGTINSRLNRHALTETGVVKISRAGGNRAATCPRRTMHHKLRRATKPMSATGAPFRSAQEYNTLWTLSAPPGL